MPIYKLDQIITKILFTQHSSDQQGLVSDCLQLEQLLSAFALLNHFTNFILRNHHKNL